MPIEPAEGAYLDRAATTPVHQHALAVMAWHLGVAGNRIIEGQLRPITVRDRYRSSAGAQ